MLINFKNTYILLGNEFYTKIHPIPVKNPYLIQFNYSLCNELGINLQNTNSQEIAKIFSGNRVLEGSDPIALVYAGHQFGHFVPQLGDGRAILLGEIIDKNGKQYDIQLKGSGQTPYSRLGDGRAALGPIMREYIVSEAMHALGIKTTRALALVGTGENVFRQSILPGAILTRIAASHLRIGTFEYFASQNNVSSLKTLANYAINRHYPLAKEALNPYQALLESVIKEQASLIANWMGIGFIHGVMNTDNMTISGETIDYGPCAFMDRYYAGRVFSSIDYYGRYSFNNQAKICLWNLMQFRESLSPLIDLHSATPRDSLQDLRHYFEEVYDSLWLKVMREKIGILHPEEEDYYLINTLLRIMHEDEADYTLTFRYLSYVSDNGKPWPYDESIFTPSNKLKQWIIKWQIRLSKQDISPSKISERMSKINPAFIPRNHILEKAIQSATNNNDFTEMRTVLKVLSNPYKEQDEYIEFMRSPMPHESVSQTFCGT